MELRFDLLKYAMAPGQVVSGIWCNLCSEFAPEVVMGAGLDFAIIDTEHVPVDLFMLVRICNRAYRVENPAHRARVLKRQVIIKRVLDARAQSLLIPMVQTEEESKSAVAHTCYPPVGVCGSAGPTRLALSTHQGLR